MAANQNSNGICTTESFTAENLVKFEECPNGFVYATFNRYSNVNFLGVEGLNANQLESEKDYMLSFRKFISAPNRNGKTYKQFNLDTDPNHERFLKANDSSLNGQLNKDDVMEFNIYLHNNGSPECNLDVSKCNNRFSYAINAILDFTNRFSNNEFKQLNLDLQYEIPDRGDSFTTTRKVKFNKAKTPLTLLKNNQKFRLLSEYEASTDEALTSGFNVNSCEKFERNKCIGIKLTKFIQKSLIAMLSDKMRFTPNYPVLNAFPSTEGNAIYINFFAKVVEEDL